VIYLIGSLRNPNVPFIARDLRAAGHEVFDDWYAAGPKADDCWQAYEQARGHNFQQALEGHAANHVYNYDRRHLDRADAAVLLMPAGKSAHLELGYVMGQGKPGFILLDQEPERFDVMYRFATVVFSMEELLSHIQSTGQESTLIPSISPRTLILPMDSEWTKSGDFVSLVEKNARDILTSRRPIGNGLYP
jgi:hypothetical protein